MKMLLRTFLMGLIFASVALAGEQPSNCIILRQPARWKANSLIPVYGLRYVFKPRTLVKGEVVEAPGWPTLKPGHEIGEREYKKLLKRGACFVVVHREYSAAELEAARKACQAASGEAPSQKGNK
jgi:hypothetical protein